MPIKLIVHESPEVADSCCGVVRISPEAESVIKQLKRETGLSVRAIVSQIIVQSQDDIEVLFVR